MVTACRDLPNLAPTPGPPLGQITTFFLVPTKIPKLLWLFLGWETEDQTNFKKCLFWWLKGLRLVPQRVCLLQMYWMWENSPRLLIPDVDQQSSSQWVAQKVLQKMTACYLWSSKEHVKHENDFLYVRDFVWFILSPTGIPGYFIPSTFSLTCGLSAAHTGSGVESFGPLGGHLGRRLVPFFFLKQFVFI